MIFQNSSQPYHLSHPCNVFPFLLPILSSSCVSRPHPYPMVFAVGFQFNVRFKYKYNNNTNNKPNNNQTTTKTCQKPRNTTPPHPPTTSLLLPASGYFARMSASTSFTSVSKILVTSSAYHPNTTGNSSSMVFSICMS